MCKGKILVVDDESDTRRVLAEYLGLSGYKAIDAGSGSEAIKLLGDESFDLLLCDYVMPGISGYEVIMSMKVLGVRPKVGLIAGWIDGISTEKKDDMKADFILEKPVDYAMLTKHIEGVLG